MPTPKNVPIIAICHRAASGGPDDVVKPKVYRVLKTVQEAATSPRTSQNERLWNAVTICHLRAAKSNMGQRGSA